MAQKMLRRNVFLGSFRRTVSSIVDYQLMVRDIFCEMAGKDIFRPNYRYQHNAQIVHH